MSYKDHFLDSIGERLNDVGVRNAGSSDCALNNAKHDEDKLIAQKMGTVIEHSLSEVSTNFSQEDLNCEKKQFHTNIENNAKTLNKKIPIPRLSVDIQLPNAYYVELQEFDGKVLDINAEEGVFAAELTNKHNSEEVFRAEFDIDDIDKGDKDLFKQGALFIWKVGKEENNGTQQKISQIVFRRLPSWWSKDIKRVEEIGTSRAAAIRELTGQDTSSKQ